MAMCFPKPLDNSDDDDDMPPKPPQRVQPVVTRNAQYEAVLKNIRAQDLKQLRIMAFRRRSLLKKPGLNENLRLWLSIEVGELSSFEDKDLKRVVSENALQTTPDGESLIHLAAQRGSNQILKFAIKAIPRDKRVAYINARSMVNEPPLLLAAQNGHRDVVCTLLHAGADVNSTNSSGETALYLACYHGFRDVAIDLIRHPKVDVERLSEESASAYGVCLVKRQLELARFVRWRSMWPVVRQLWIARRKNSLPACPLSTAPDSFIKMVVTLLICSEVALLSAVKK